MIEDLQARLQARADPERKAWWERYLKGEAAFRGVAMPAIRRELRAWHAEHRLGECPPEEGKALAFALMEQPLSEDKLAGILLLRELLFEHVGRGDLPRLARLFAEGHVADWSVCDWLGVKLLAGLVRRDGAPLARSLADWRRAGPLWQRRAAAVSLAPLAPAGNANFPGFTALALEVCEANVRDPARFSQTGVGWLLRELSKAEPAAVRAFVADHEGDLSREARRMALAKLEGRGRR